MRNSNRDFEQVSEELSKVGESLRNIHPREVDGPAGTTFKYTSAQKAKMQRLEGRRKQLQEAQRALLRNS